MRGLLFAFASLLVVTISAAEPTWDTLRLPTEATPRDVARYLHSVRVLTNDQPPDAPRPRQAPPIEPGLVAKARAALDRVLPAHLELVVKECKSAERDWKQEQGHSLQTTEGARMVTSYNQASDHYRSKFTRIAFERIAALRDMDEAQRQLLFREVGEFPELMLGIMGKPWHREIDAYLSPRLIRHIDRNTGWRDTSVFWVEALLQVNSARSAEALECMFVECPNIRLSVYEALRNAPSFELNLPGVVAKAWKAHVGETSRGNRAKFAAIAAQHGVTPALIELAEYVQTWWPKAAPPKAGAALLALVDGEFADAKQAADFVTKNAKALSFDRTTAKYSGARSNGP